jgi:ABC-type multidrug transport system fused ATPase/permease subunit
MVTSRDKQQAVVGKQPKNGTVEMEKFEAPSQQSSPVIEKKKMEKCSIQVMYFDDNKNHDITSRREESREEMQRRNNGVNVVEDVRDTLPTVDLDKLHMAAASIVHKFGNHVVSCLDVPTLVTDAKMRQDDELLMAVTSSAESAVDILDNNNVVVADASTISAISIPHGSNDDVGHKTDYTNDVKRQQKKILEHPISSIFNERDGHTLDFDNISLSAKTKKGNKDILKGVSSSFQPKTLTALMGPSGSGKTSLLKVLTGRLSNKSSKLNLTGTIKLDGRIVDPTSINIRKQIAYVEQDVSIPATSTPREAIRFSAR